MKMVFGPVCFGIVLVFAVACGPGSNAGAGGSGGGGGDSFTGDGAVNCSTLPRLAIQVSSPLPTELSSGCASGNVAELDAILTLSKGDPCGDTFNCPLTANGAGASGSCPNIPSDENYTIDLLYRALHSTGGQWNVAQQSKYVEIPATAADPFALSFAGEAVTPIGQNLTNWCSGNF